MMSEEEKKPGALAKCWAQREARHMKVLLKSLSLLTGLALLTAGVVGLSAIFFLQLVYFVGSIYTIFFGSLVLVVELRDKLPLVSALYSLVDRYLKFLTLQRGKGGFYLCVGLLVLYIGPDGTSHWGLNNVAALFLAVVGFLHFFRIVKESAPALGPSDSGTLEHASSGSSQWTDLVNQNK